MSPQGTRGARVGWCGSAGSRHLRPRILPGVIVELQALPIELLEAAALPYPGANLPAKVMPGEPQGVVIDWRAALAEFTKK
jgi:hypothetical protein